MIRKYSYKKKKNTRGKNNTAYSSKMKTTTKIRF